MLWSVVGSEYDPESEAVRKNQLLSDARTARTPMEAFRIAAEMLAYGAHVITIRMMEVE